MGAWGTNRKWHLRSEDEYNYFIGGGILWCRVSIG